jgi:thioredoxin-related protein
MYKMKRFALLILAVLILPMTMKAGDKSKKEDADDNTEIHWLSLDDLQVKMKEHPKLVYMDIYTDWCGWCKRMEATTFHNPQVIKYMNDNFYCVRLNAERKDTIRFVGKTYYYEPQYRANTLAVDLMRGQMSYPTSVIMEDHFQSATPIPGYQDVPTMEMIVKYFGEHIYKTQHFDEYQKTFKSTWNTDANDKETMNEIPLSH